MVKVLAGHDSLNIQPISYFYNIKTKDINSNSLPEIFASLEFLALLVVLFQTFSQSAHSILNY